MDTQHVWTIYQAVSNVDETLVEECLWRYERFSNAANKELEQVGRFKLATPLTVEEFARLGAVEQRNLIKANVDTTIIESA